MRNAGSEHDDLQAAREAIRLQLWNYGRASDRRDMALMKAVWHDDATVEALSLPDYKTPMAMFDYFLSATTSGDVVVHPIMPTIIEVKGDQAVSEAYACTLFIQPLGEGRLRETVSHVRYYDRWSRRDGRWAIQHRKVVTDIRYTCEKDAQYMIRPNVPDGPDPSYAVFAAL